MLLVVVVVVLSVAAGAAGWSGDGCSWEGPASGVDESSASGARGVSTTNDPWKTADSQPRRECGAACGSASLCRLLATVA